MLQIFSIGARSGLQAGQFSTRTLLVWSHAVVLAAVCGFALSCWNTQGLPWNGRHLEGNICCSKTFIYLSAYIVPSKKCKLPILYTFMQSIPSEMLPFELNAENMLEDLLYSLARRTWCLWFPTRMSNLDSFDHKTLFHFETFHFKWAFAHRTWQRFWTMFTYGFLFAW